MDGNQLNFEDLIPEEVDAVKAGEISVVKADFSDHLRCGWRELFEGYDELYGITFSSGIPFMEKVIDMFSHVEMIFGCEGVMNNDIAAIMAMQTESVELLAKSQCAVRMAERMDDGTLKLSVSRDTRSHEKIYILKSYDGRCRVITGSANMSASAFCGLQREDIVCFDDEKAFEYYKDRFDDFQTKCADNINKKVILALNNDLDYIRDNIETIPIISTVNEKVVILEQTENEFAEEEIVLDIKGLENEIKPMMPKPPKETRRLVLDGNITKQFARKYSENNNVKKEKARKLPKLHIDYDNGILSFNDKEFNLSPSADCIVSDLKCLDGYMSSLSSFIGNYTQAQKDYYSFLNWYFASLFMPMLRRVGEKNDYGVLPFPVYGIIYGDSNGGKSTFVGLLSKMMCGTKIPFLSSSDFTSGNIEKLKRACEGLPLNIDDLAKLQYDSHYEKIIKDDTWGIADGFINYPAVAISTNKVKSLKSDISKRTVTCFINIRLDKEAGARNSKRINESIRQASTALYCEYVRHMISCVNKMAEDMKNSEKGYFPDIFKESSKTLKSIFEEYAESVPEYVSELSYSDYFGDMAVGKNAMKKLIVAWDNDKKHFKIDEKKHTLAYEYADSSRTYELTYIQQELPPVLEASVVGSTLVMNLDKAREVFKQTFKKRFWE